MQPDDLHPRNDPRYIRVRAIELRARLRKIRRDEEVPESIFEGIAQDSLAQMYAARQAFSDDCRDILTKSLLSYSAGGFVFFEWILNDKPRTLVQSIVSCAICVAAWSVPLFCNKTWVRKIDHAYTLYIAGVIHSTIVARALKMPLTHAWMESVARTSKAFGYFDDPQDMVQPDMRLAPDEGEQINCRRIHRDRVFTFCPLCQPPRIDESRQIIAIWRDSGPNFFTGYRLLIKTYLVTASQILVIASLLMLLVAWYRPGLVWYRDVETSCPALSVSPVKP